MPQQNELSSTTFMIKTVGLSKTYQGSGIQTHAVSHVDLAISKGDYIVIQGPSGCGKSTLLRTLALLERPTSGKLEIAGRDAMGVSESERAKIRNILFGFVFQNNNLLPELTVLENVIFPLRFNRNLSRSEMAKRGDDILGKVDLQSRRNHFPDALSGGQQQRVAVARALITSPAVIFADEPTGNLDSTNGDRVMDLLQGAHRNGAAICLVTHDARYASSRGKLLRMLDGRIVE